MKLVTSIRQVNNFISLITLARWLLSLFMLTILSGCLTNDVVMSPQREGAFRAKVLELDEKILFHKLGNWYLYKERNEVRCYLENDAEVVLTNKHILLVNTCSHYNNLDPVLKWSYKEITELVHIYTKTFGIEHGYSVKFRVKDENDILMRVQILIRPITYSSEVFSVIEKHIPKGTPAFSRDMLEDKKYNHTWP